MHLCDASSGARGEVLDCLGHSWGPSECDARTMEVGEMDVEGRELVESLLAYAPWAIILAVQPQVSAALRPAR